MRTSKKNYIVTLLLCFFLGNFGAHRFYVGKIGTGLLMIFTLGGFGIWLIIDFILIVCGQFKDKKNRYIQPEGLMPQKTAHEEDRSEHKRKPNN